MLRVVSPPLHPCRLCGEPHDRRSPAGTKLYYCSPACSTAARKAELAASSRRQREEAAERRGLVPPAGLEPLPPGYVELSARQRAMLRDITPDEARLLSGAARRWYEANVARGER